MFKKMICVFAFIFFTGLFAENLYNQAPANKSYTELQAKMNSLIQTALNVKNTKPASEAKNVLAHFGIGWTCWALGICAFGMDRDAMTLPASFVCFISYILMRTLFYQGLVKNNEQEIILKNLEKSIKNISIQSNNLSKSEKTLLVGELERGINQIKNKKSSKRIVSWIFDHLIPLIPAIALAKSNAKIGIGVDFNDTNKFVEGPENKFFSLEDGNTDACDLIRKRQLILSVVYYLSLIGLFDYVLAPKYETPELISKIESEINEMKLGEGQKPTCQA